MGRGPSVTKEEYGFIKQLLAKGKTTEEIRRQVNRSPDTVRCVNYSIDYDDFVNTPTKTLRQRCKKQPEQQKMDFAKAVEKVFGPKEPDRRVKYKVEVTVWEYQY